MTVEIACRKCGQSRRVDLGEPAGRPREEFLRLVVERLAHQPSFECFGGHVELRPPLPEFWEIRWESLRGEE